MTVLWHAIAFAGIVFLAPFVQGAIKTLRARLSGRPGPSPVQPYRDLAKLLRKEAVVAQSTSPLVLAAPGCVLGVAITVAAFVPLRDAVAIALALALGRFALVIAALDTQSGFEGMAASREMTFAALSELPVIAAIIAAALSPAPAIAHVLAGAALLIVLLFETARIPVDSQETHYELTMIHEGQMLEFSGWHLAFLHYAAWVRQLALLLLAALLLPGPSAFAPVWIALFVVAGAVMERGLAKHRLFDVPQLFATATILALAAIGAQIAGTSLW